MKRQQAKIVKSGTWFYDFTVSYEVWIVRQNFEYWYEESFDEAERLNPDGEVFAVVNAQHGKFISNGGEFFTIEEATAAADSAISQSIEWDNHRLQKLFRGREYSLSDAAQPI